MFVSNRPLCLMNFTKKVCLLYNNFLLSHIFRLNYNPSIETNILFIGINVNGNAQEKFSLVYFFFYSFVCLWLGVCVCVCIREWWTAPAWTRLPSDVNTINWCQSLAPPLSLSLGNLKGAKKTILTHSTSLRGRGPKTPWGFSRGSTPNPSPHHASIRVFLLYCSYAWVLSMRSSPNSEKESRKEKVRTRNSR